MFRSLIRIQRIMNSNELGQRWTEFLKLQRCLLSSSSENQPAAKEESDLTNNPYYSKYADKLKKAKPNVNASNLKSNLNEEERKTKERLKALEDKLEKKDQSSQRNASKEIGKSTSESTKSKSLNDIIKMELIKDLGENEIKHIWFEHFKSKENTIFGCLSPQNYNEIKENFIKHPVFVFLLPVNDPTDSNKNANDKTADLNNTNYQFVLVQFDKLNNKCYFTPLAFYHTHKENAPAALVLNYYDEIKQDKNIVLMEGEYDNKVFNLLEAQCLVNQIQIFYANKNKTDLLNNFTNNPSTFDYMNIVRDFEKNIAISN